MSTGRRERKAGRVREQAQAGTWSPGRCTGVAFGPPRSGLVLCKGTCSINAGVEKTKILRTELVNQNARNFLELTVCRGKPTIGQRLSINCDRENGVTRRSPSIRAGTRGVPSRPEERTPWGKGCRSVTPRELLGLPSYRLRNQRAQLPGKRRRPAMEQGVEARSRRAGMKDGRNQGCTAQMKIGLWLSQLKGWCCPFPCGL